MKTFKKVLSLALVAIMALTVLSACNMARPNSTVKISTLEEEKGATLKILIPGHNAKDPEAWQNKVVEEYKKLYPDVTVEFVTAAWENWYEKLMAAYTSGDPIDIIHDGVNTNPKFPLEGITQPLQYYVNMENPNMHIKAMDACFKYNGNYYVAASETNFGVIFYNKDTFSAAGLEDPMSLYNKGQWNWSNFVRAAKALTNKDKGTFGFGTEFPYLFYGSNATSTLKLDENGHYSLNMDDPAFVAALEIIQDGTYKSGWSGWETSAMGSFQTGKIAMVGSFTMYEADVNALAALYGWDPINYGVVPLPAGPNNTEGLNMVHSAGYSIGAGSDCPAHAGKLIDMLMDGHAAYQAERNKQFPASHLELYQKMAEKQICVNTRDSAIGGGYSLPQAIANGQSIAQAIEEFKPQFQKDIDTVNGK